MSNYTHVILAPNITPNDLIAYPLEGNKFKKGSSAIVHSDTYQMQLPETFRFSTYVELIKMQNNTIEFIFTRPKSSRWHDYYYSEIIDELSFRSKDVVAKLEKYIRELKDKGLVLVVQDEDSDDKESTTEETQQVSFSIGDHYEVLIMLLNVRFNKSAKLSHDEQKQLDQQIIPISDNFVLSHILNKRGLTTNEIDNFIISYKKEQNLNESELLDVADETTLDGLLLTIKKSEIFQEERQEIRKDMIKIGKTPVNYAVFDKKNNLTFEASFGGHYQVVTEIIAKYHYDQFMRLSQEQKDQFILENFVLIGTYHPSTSKYYTPSDKDVEFSKNFNSIQPTL